MTQLQVEYVTNTTAFPWRAVVQVQVKWSDGTSTVGSGAVVGPNDVLTAAHVVYDPARGRAENITVTPGVNGTERPFGSFGVSNFQYYKVGGYSGTLSRSEVRSDVAILQVENPTPIGETTGWFGLRALGMREGQTANLNSAGYPTTFASDGPRMVRTFDDERFEDGIWEHSISEQTGRSWGGHSGAPYFVLEDGERAIVGVHSTSAEATHISSSIFGRLVDWIRGNGDGHGAPGGGAPGEPPRDDGGSSGGGGSAESPRSKTKLGGDGADRLIGGRGDDRLDGRGGDDELRGRVGDDRLIGGRGDDRLFGAGGDDRMFGGKGEDELRGGAGHDVLKGAGGDDRLLGGGGIDAMAGGRGDDSLAGGTGDDVLTGGRGADVLIGGKGHDIMTGGGGADVFVFDRRDVTFGSGSRNDEIRDFQPGTDQIRFRDFAAIDIDVLTSKETFVVAGTAVGGTELVFPGGGGAAISLIGVRPGDLTDADLVYGFG